MAVQCVGRKPAVWQLWADETVVRGVLKDTSNDSTAKQKYLLYDSLFWKVCARLRVVTECEAASAFFLVKSGTLSSATVVTETPGEMFSLGFQNCTRFGEMTWLPVFKKAWFSRVSSSRL